MNATIEKIKNFFLKKLVNSQSDGTETTEGVWEKMRAFFASAFKFSLAFLFIILIGHTIYELFRYDLVIKPFETPFNLGRQGYTGTVVAYRLQYYMDEIREELETHSIGMDKGVATIQFSELAERQEIDVSTIGLSLNAIIAQIRRMLGIKQQRVSGDIVVRHDQLYLTLRITGKPAVIFSDDDDQNPESVIKEAARHVFETFNPLTVGLNHCFNYKNNALDDLIAYHKKIQVSDKERAVRFILEACLLKNQRQYDKALIKLAQAEKHDRKNPALFQVRGDTLQAHKKYEQSIDAYKRAAKYDPQNGDIYTQLARVFIAYAKKSEETSKNRLLEKAFAQYEIASKKDPKNPWVYTDWGYQLARVQKHFEQAEEKFAQAIAIRPDYALAYATWGDMLLQNRRQYKQASEKYEKAVALNPNLAWVYGNWGVALFKLKEYEKAIVQYKEAIERKPLAWVYKDWGEALLHLGKYESAIERYKQALKLKPNEHSYYYLWGNALFDLKQYQQAIEQYKKALALKPKKRLYYYVWGNALIELEQYEDAVTQFEEALKINPKHIWSKIKLGYALRQNQQPEKALNQCQAILESKLIVSQTAGANALCGLALVALNQPKKAIEKCKKALVYKKTDWAYRCLGDALIQLNKPDEAVTQYKEAVNLKPEKALYYYKWGQALTQLGQNDAAITQYQQAITFDLGDQISKQAQDQIEALKEKTSPIFLEQDSMD